MIYGCRAVGMLFDNRCVSRPIHQHRSAEALSRLKKSIFREGNKYMYETFNEIDIDKDLNLLKAEYRKLSQMGERPGEILRNYRLNKMVEKIIELCPDSR